jgi:acylphosphatase
MTGGGGRKSVRLRIEGLVQGVWFRAWTEREAKARGLDGWVRNRDDGSVEAALAGPAPLVDEMIALCWHGPRAARVSNVDTSPEIEAVSPGFRQQPTP